MGRHETRCGVAPADAAQVTRHVSLDHPRQRGRSCVSEDARENGIAPRFTLDDIAQSIRAHFRR
jgi:hypothetical protein